MSTLWPCFFLNFLICRSQHLTAMELQTLSHLDRGPREKKFLEEDRLLEVLLCSTKQQQQRPNGKFRGSFGFPGQSQGQSGRRARRCPQYSELMMHYPGLIEDLNPGLTESVLCRIHQWHFNAFLLDRFSGGHSLSSLCLHIFHSSGIYIENIPASPGTI